MNIQDLINKIGVDKFLHFAFGGWIVSFFMIWYYQLAVALVLGVAKELIDKYFRHQVFDYKDMLWTWAGGILTILINLII